ncbi:penicillin-binding protein 1C [Marinicauda algicola]|uniref:penicillin-binding protein 1C n=1 Tax=Marinicauda algicola TaxID=2029849 RepID=UPI001F1446B7|nr:penicillin-binding protein 1C [Marinicauda algicola]
MIAGALRRGAATCKRIAGRGAALRRALVARRWPRRGAVALGAVAGTLGLLLALDALFPPPIERGRVVSTVVADREGRALRAFPVEDGRWRLAADLTRLDPDFVEALIAVEDARFRSHPGVDPLAVVRAGLSAVSAGRIVSGASTITMQTARLLEPRPRTLGSKVIEMVRAVQLERRLSKDEILELYLTLTPYGGNLQGVRAASWAWFDREPDELTPDQIALLIALPQAPEARRPDLEPDNAVAARRAILMRLAAAGLISESRAEEAAGEPAPARHAFPAEAWHASAAARAAEPGAAEVRSTLDSRLQRELERLALGAAERAGDGVQVSVLAVEIEGRAVRASVGSASRNRAGGWIDLTTRARSPGSTLKPLIYAMAFDDGVAAATTRIEDLPRRFAGYRPENFDRTFRGEVTIAEALQHSLNVPAVHVLDAVGANRFAAALAFAGGEPVLPESHDSDVGLALALGGLGLSVRELALLYAALGDGGEALPLAWTEAEAARVRAMSGPHLVSAESADEILDILERAPAPPGRMPASLTANAPRIAFKTGTSYGFRDAWAAGVAGGYAIVVWTGRPDGAPRPGVTGREAALPLLFDAFDAAARLDPDFATPHSVPRALERAPATLAAFNREDAPPQILFPPENAEIWMDSEERGFVLAARGEGELAWYADGRPVARDPGGAPVWSPHGPGFFELTVVDAAGRAARTRVRVRTPSG